MLTGKQDLKIVSLVNIADVKRNPDLADRYNRDLVELANPNVKKLDNAEDNAALSSLFAMFPLVSTLQTGAGSYNPLSLSAILPQEVYYNIMSNVGQQWSDKYLDRTELRKIAFLNENGRYYIDYTERVERPVMVEPEVTQLELFEKPEPVVTFSQNFVSGVSRQEAKAEIKQALNTPNPTSMEMILAGFRTRTTRTNESLAENPIKVGDVIEHEGIVSNGKVKSVKAVVTAIYPKGTTEFESTWNLEGWTDSGINKITESDVTAIVFKVVGIDAVTANQDYVGEKIINDADISSFKKYVKKAKGYPQQFFTSTTTFTEFYNNNTGRREGAPQTSSWIRQSNGRYDLIDVMTGEEYITNVDLETGLQYLSPSQVQVETPAQTEDVTLIDEIPGVRFSFDEQKYYDSNPMDIAKEEGKIYRGVSLEDTQYKINPDGSLTLFSQSNFDGKQSGISMTPYVDVAFNYARRSKSGTSRLVTQRGVIIEISDLSLINNSEVEAYDEVSYQGGDLVIPSGKYKIYDTVTGEYQDEQQIPGIVYEFVKGSSQTVSQDLKGVLLESFISEGLSEIAEFENRNYGARTVDDYENNVILEVFGRRDPLASAIAKLLGARLYTYYLNNGKSLERLKEIVGEDSVYVDSPYGAGTYTYSQFIDILLKGDMNLKSLKGSYDFAKKWKLLSIGEISEQDIQQQIEAINIQLDLFKENKPGNKPGTNRTELNGCNV